jgi:hypothetical protein
VPSDPDRPHEELSAGIDLASNISRFLTYLTSTACASRCAARSSRRPRSASCST